MLSVAELQLLTDTLPSSDPHNLSARILRQGVAISAFSSLEKYLEARVEVLVKLIPASAITVSSLGEDLRSFLSIDAVMGLANRLNFADKSSRQAYGDSQLAALAQYSGTPAAYTALGFSPRGSNVSESDVGRALSAFGVVRPWIRLSQVAREIGSARLSLKEDFTSLAKARHRSAHDPTSNIPSSDLRTHIETAILIAVCFDCLASAISRAMTTATNFTHFETTIAAAQLTYAFVDAEIDGAWVERASDGMRVRKRHRDEDAAVESALARSGSAVVVIRDSQGVPLAVP